MGGTITACPHRVAGRPPVAMLAGEERKHLHRLARVAHTLCSGALDRKPNARTGEEQAFLALGESAEQRPSRGIDRTLPVDAVVDALL